MPVGEPKATWTRPAALFSPGTPITRSLQPSLLRSPMAMDSPKRSLASLAPPKVSWVTSFEEADPNVRPVDEP